MKLFHAYPMRDAVLILVKRFFFRSSLTRIKRGGCSFLLFFFFCKQWNLCVCIQIKKFELKHVISLTWIGNCICIQDQKYSQECLFAKSGISVSGKALCYITLQLPKKCSSSSELNESQFNFIIPSFSSKHCMQNTELICGVRALGKLIFVYTPCFSFI